jgi:hypothetical protein
MPLEIDKISRRTMPIQEIALSKLALELHLGDRFKAMVMAINKNNEITLNINGKNINAKTSHAFLPGDVLDLHVEAIGEHSLLKVQDKTTSLSHLKNVIMNQTLLQTLPRQAAPTNLLDSLSQLSRMEQLPTTIFSQIKAILNSIIPLEQLPHDLMGAILQSGVFLESALLKDLKGQYIRLLSSLEVTNINAMGLSNTVPGPNLSLEYDTLPLPGAVPQPTQQNTFLNLLHESPETIQNLLYKQLSDVLARITTQQIHHLSRTPEQGYALLLDLPIKTTQGIFVIPLLIEEHKAAAPVSSMWSISFALSLPSLGKLQGTVSLYQRNHINLNVFVEELGQKTEMENLEAEIRQILNELELNLNQFTIALGLKPNYIEPDKFKLLDLRI